ncbi:hypothetical protein HYN48_09755 [Flavobacterium magnum]|uniref:Polysaccharide deacetylase n=1 Tax=Flavobacterium magnum TaxID=2162713 RepID=A0A2S0RFP1_9FLAO|nr:hypothetical protein [Flavobacterium magnum]AWA30349.1 hypothetical protein HYN48_09755 [Flavobacterium magnum]
MKTKLLSVLLFALASNLSGQAKKEIYQFSKDIEAQTDKDTVPWKYQLSATDYSISGHYEKALQDWDKNGSRAQQLSAQDSAYFRSFQKYDAKAYIVNRSKNEKVIIINEAHHNARHRVFTASLLQGLYDNGYRYFGLEALSDTLINNRKFVTSESGYYTNEPQMANLIREAIRIGFTVFGYDAEDVSNGKQREIAQAQHISKLMKAHPEAKFLIHCGWDHAIEGTPGNKSWEKAMAGRLKELTGIDPFTIDQTAYSEKSNVALSSPFIEMAHTEKTVILVDSHGKTFNGSATNDQTDCRIIHPATRYLHGRPDWLLMDGARKSYAVPKSRIKECPVLVLAYREKEAEHDGIPADLIEITNRDTPASLILSEGRYTIVMKDRNYKTINTFQAKVR